MAKYSLQGLFWASVPILLSMAFIVRSGFAPLVVASFGGGCIVGWLALRLTSGKPSKSTSAKGQVFITLGVLMGLLVTSIVRTLDSEMISLAIGAFAGGSITPLMVSIIPNKPPPAD
jgi:hypothetical protein